MKCSISLAMIVGLGSGLGSGCDGAPCSLEGRILSAPGTPAGNAIVDLSVYYNASGEPVNRYFQERTDSEGHYHFDFELPQDARERSSVIVDFYGTTQVSIHLEPYGITDDDFVAPTVTVWDWDLGVTIESAVTTLEWAPVADDYSVWYELDLGVLDVDVVLEDPVLALDTRFSQDAALGVSARAHAMDPDEMGPCHVIWEATPAQLDTVANVPLSRGAPCVYKPVGYEETELAECAYTSGTYFGASVTPPDLEMIMVDLGSPSLIGSVAMTGARIYPVDADARIDVSQSNDGATFVPVGEVVTGRDSPGAILEFADAIEARYVRLTPHELGARIGDLVQVGVFE